MPLPLARLQQPRRRQMHEIINEIKNNKLPPAVARPTVKLK